jgi:hypothetical protein
MDDGLPPTPRLFDGGMGGHNLSYIDSVVCPMRSHF